MSEIYDPRFDDLPANPVEYPLRLAHDLAWGKHNKKWSSYFTLREPQTADWTFFIDTPDTNLKTYLDFWGNKIPDCKMLVNYGYLKIAGDTAERMAHLYELTESALRLPETKSSASIFISYSRKESSALALLIVARFKEYGRVPFLDMNHDRDGQENKLDLGGVWRDDLANAIKERDTVILLLGPTTLYSEYVRLEIELALNNGKRIIWFRHNGFDAKNHIPDMVSQRVRELINEKQGEIVIAESPKQYNASIDALLAKFGIAP